MLLLCNLPFLLIFPSPNYITIEFKKLKRLNLDIQNKSTSFSTRLFMICKCVCVYGREREECVCVLSGLQGGGKKKYSFGVFVMYGYKGINENVMCVGHRGNFC